MPISVLWGIRPNFFGLSPCVRQVAYALLTRPPVATIKSKLFNVLPLDLHVLGLSLAFILSQDQTLRCIFFFFFIIPSKRYLTELTSFSLISCTTLASSIPSMNFSLQRRLRGLPVLRKCCKDTAFLYYNPNFSQCFSELFFYEMKTFSFSDCYS